MLLASLIIHSCNTFLLVTTGYGSKMLSLENGWEERTHTKVLATVSVVTAWSSFSCWRNTLPMLPVVLPRAAGFAAGAVLFAGVQEGLRAVRQHHDALNSMLAGAAAGAVMVQLAQGRKFRLLGAVVWGPACGLAHLLNSALRPRWWIEDWLIRDGLLSADVRDLRPRPRPLTPAQAAAAQEAADTALRAALLQDAIEVRTREMRDLNHRLADEAFHRAEGIQTARIRGSSSGGVSSNGRTEGQARPRLQAIKFAAPFWGSQSGAPAAFSPASSSSTSSLSTSRLSTTSASASSSSTSSDSSCPAPVDSNQVHRAEAAVSVLELSEAKSSHRGRGWFGWRSHAPEKLHYNSGEPTGAGSGRGSALGISTSSGSGQQQHDAELDVHDNDEDFQAWLRVSGLTAEALFDAERQQEQQQQAALQQGQGFEQGHEQEEGTSGEVLAFVGGQQAHAGSGEKTKGQLGQGRNTQTSSWWGWLQGRHGRQVSEVGQRSNE